MRSLRLPLLLALPLVATGTSRADEPSARRWEIHAGPARIHGLRLALGLSTTADPDAGTLKNRNYDDGFNRVDATNNLGDGAAGPLSSRTGYFAFTSNSQVNLTAGTLSLHTVNFADTDGVERPLRSAGAVNLGTSRVIAQPTERLAIKLGLDLDWQPERTTRLAVNESATARVLTDSYRLGGVVPQQAPYTGHFTPQPGDQRIGDTPTRSLSTASATATGGFEAQTSVALGRFGPILSYAASPAWELQLGAGLAAARIHTIATETSSLASAGLPATSHAASADATVTRTGVFAEGKVTYRHSPRWSIELAASRHDLGQVSRGTLTLDASRLTSISLRLGRSF